MHRVLLGIAAIIAALWLGAGCFLWIASTIFDAASEEMQVALWACLLVPVALGAGGNITVWTEQVRGSRTRQ